MSTDNYYVRVGKTAGREVTLHCLTGFGGGFTDYASGRAFGLMLLLDAKRRADPTEFLVRGLPKAVARERVALAKKSSKAKSPLHAELGEPPVWDAAWHAEHTPRFVARSRLLARHNAVGEGRLQKIIDELSPLQQKGKGLFLDAAWARLHHFDVSVEVTDEKYLQHLVEGHVFGTTAYDAWIEKQLPPKKKVSAKKPKLAKPKLTKPMLTKPKLTKPAKQPVTARRNEKKRRPSRAGT